MKPAEKDIRIWAWNCGAAPLSILAVIFERSSDFQANLNGIPTLVKRIALQRRNESDRAFYKSARDLLEDLAWNARILIKLPETLAALRREPHPFQRIERDLYREFLRYDIEVAESMVFAFKVGIFQFVADWSTPWTESAKSQLLKAWKQAADRAGEDFSKYKSLFEAYLDIKIDGKSFVNKTADIYFRDKVTETTSAWTRFREAIQLSPNIHGVGIDFWKLIGR
jgi:hypothetical protein